MFGYCVVLLKVKVEHNEIGEDVGQVSQDAEERQAAQIAVETESRQQRQQADQPRHSKYSAATLQFNERKRQKNNRQIVPIFDTVLFDHKNFSLLRLIV